MWKRTLLAIWMLRVLCLRLAEISSYNRYLHRKDIMYAARKYNKLPCIPNIHTSTQRIALFTCSLSRRLERTLRLNRFSFQLPSVSGNVLNNSNQSAPPPIHSKKLLSQISIHAGLSSTVNALVPIEG